MKSHIIILSTATNILWEILIINPGLRDDVIKMATIATTNTVGPHTSELQSHHDLVCRLLLEKKKQTKIIMLLLKS